MDTPDTDTASEASAGCSCDSDGKFQPLPELKLDLCSRLSFDPSFEECSKDYSSETDGESSSTTDEDDTEAPRQWLIPDIHSPRPVATCSNMLGLEADTPLPLVRMPSSQALRPSLNRRPEFFLRYPPGLSRRNPLPPDPPPKITLTPFGLDRETRHKLRAWQTRSVIHPHTDQLITQPAGFHPSFYNRWARGTPGDKYAEKSRLYEPFETGAITSMRGIGRKFPLMFWRTTDPITRDHRFCWEVNGRRSCLEIERANTYNLATATGKEYEPRMLQAWENKVSGRRGGVMRPLVGNAMPVKQMARNFLKWGTLKEKHSGKSDMQLPSRLLDDNRKSLEPKKFTLVMRSAKMVLDPHKVWPRYTDARNNYFLFPRVGHGAVWGPAITRIGQRRVAADWSWRCNTPSPPSTPSISPTSPPHETLLLRDGLELTTIDAESALPPENEVDITMPEVAAVEIGGASHTDDIRGHNNGEGAKRSDEFAEGNAEPLFEGPLLPAVSTGHVAQESGLHVRIHRNPTHTPITEQITGSELVEESFVFLNITDAPSDKHQLKRSHSVADLLAGVRGHSGPAEVSHLRRTISDVSDADEDGGVHLDLTDADIDAVDLGDVTMIGEQFGVPHPEHDEEEMELSDSSSSSDSDSDESEFAEYLPQASQPSTPAVLPPRHIQATHRRFRLSPSLRHEMFIRRAWAYHRQQQMEQTLANLFSQAGVRDE
jgi:hypothetical protein